MLIETGSFAPVFHIIGNTSTSTISSTPDLFVFPRDFLEPKAGAKAQANHQVDADPDDLEGEEMAKFKNTFSPIEEAELMKVRPCGLWSCSSVIRYLP